jgi:hypothetical protein
MEMKIIENFEGIRKKNARFIYGILLILSFIAMIYS